MKIEEEEKEAPFLSPAAKSSAIDDAARCETEVGGRAEDTIVYYYY